MLVGVFAVLSVLDISATSAPKEESVGDKLKKYLTTKYDTPEAKLATMKIMREQYGYRLYADELSGEVAVLDIASGQILFSNPYDIATSNGTASTKEQLMSQIIVKYVDNDTEKFFYSFSEAGYRGQIKLKNIKNGIRIEYTLGREETRMLVPRMIEKNRFETVLDAPIRASFDDDSSLFLYKKFRAYYTLKDTSEQTSDRARRELEASFPITKKMAVYIFDPDASETELRKVEEIIKTYCPAYTYEELDRDHEMTEYEGADRAPALFKMALEYTLDEKGLSVRLPANGIRFDESEYQLTNISILPYMGAGANYAGEDKNKEQKGYTLFPDGSGSIYRFEKVKSLTSTNISGKVYGMDYAYHVLTGAQQEVVRVPAFGLVSNEVKAQTVKVTDSDGNSKMVQQDVQVDRGYLAIIEEGDALAEIFTVHSSSLHKYNSMQMVFYPRPKDTYNMRDAISVGQNATWTVVSSRKYVGNYKIRYVMLTDQNIAREKALSNTYAPSWVGMAFALRDYMSGSGILTRLAAEDINEDIPLYIETFGTIETVEKVLSIPVTVMAPLTSFEDIMTMYNDLSEDGVTNINFKLTGYANGGMYYGVPYKLSWEKSVGGKNGFKELAAYASEKGFGVYPDFDFVYSNFFMSTMFDGFSQKKHLAKTIDNRYAVKREYSATFQSFTSYWDNAISPAYYSHFYEKFTENYLKYGYGSISLSTLGTDLNSDFDEDEPYNREDSKEFTMQALQYFKEKYDSVMVTGGNAYTWKYVDHILGVSLDSSRHNKSSNSVPFLGVVLHGSKEFAGSPLNMEGNVSYAILRAIENGASPYFTLSYQNTALLKDHYYYSKYYSIRYDIWYDELVAIYKQLNNVLSDVQTKLIVGHEFLVGERVPDADELEADILAAMKEAEKQLATAEQNAALQAIKNVLTARLTAKNNATKIEALLATAVKASEDAMTSIAAIETALLAIPAVQAELDAAKANEAAALAAYTAAQDATKAAKEAYDAVRTGTDTEATQAAKAVYDAAVKAESTAKSAYTTAQNATKTAQTNYTNADKNLDTALKTGTTAADTADKAAQQAEALANEARVAAQFVNAIDSATPAIKLAATQYADKAAADAVKTAEYAQLANDNAAVAKAISADRTVASIISTAQAAAQTAATRAAEVITRYETLLNAKATYEQASIDEAAALKTYEEAAEAYEKAVAASLLPTATEADKAAAAEAGAAMNAAKSAYTAAQTNATKARNSLTSSTTALKNTLQRVLDAQNSALAAAKTTAEALEAAKEAAQAIDKLQGVSEMLKNAAIESCDAAAVAAEDVNLYVEAAKTAYTQAAELVKDYVVIIEEPKVEEPEVIPPVIEEPAGDNEDETAPAEEDEEKSEQQYGDYTYTKYTNDNGNIVKVTYGDRDADGNIVAYKTIILNYNFFDVTVVIDGVKYTIPQAGYVVFYH